MSEDLITFEEAVMLVCERLRRCANSPDLILLRDAGPTGARELLLDARRAGIISISIDNSFKTAKSLREIEAIKAEAWAARTDPEVRGEMLVRRGWMKKQALAKYLDGILPTLAPADTGTVIPFGKLKKATDVDVREAPPASSPTLST
jgi:hypothetical protein